VIFLLCCIPIFLWNYNNDFISYTYHENRVSITETGLQPQYFLTEIAGEFFYNNPVNVVIIIAAMVALLRGRQFLRAEYRRIILWISVPLVLVFISFSLFRSTLPHWTGPGYLGFIVIAAAYLSEPRRSDSRKRLVPWPVAISLAFLMLVAVTAIGQIRYGWIPLSRWKADDVSTDLAGWKQLGGKFAQLAKMDEEKSRLAKGSPMLTFRWFPAANFDYYLGRQTGKPVYAIGSLERIHKYHWINNIRGNLKQGSDAYYVALSDDYEDPAALYGALFDTIRPADTLYITRGQDTIRKAFVYRLMNLKTEMIFSSGKPPE
jgi:hypothetical protein